MALPLLLPVVVRDICVPKMELMVIPTVMVEGFWWPHPRPRTVPPRALAARIGLALPGVLLSQGWAWQCTCSARAAVGRAGLAAGPELGWDSLAATAQPGGTCNKAWCPGVTPVSPSAAII